jgi:hypothetical protein
MNGTTTSSMLMPPWLITFSPGLSNDTPDGHT